MNNKNISVEDLFYYLPRTSVNNDKTKVKLTIKKINIHHLKTNKNNSFSFSKGSSTFDFLNDLNKDKYKYPILKSPFLPKSKRSIEIHKNILNKIIKYRQKNVNSSDIFKLSDSCDFFIKLNKTFMSDKNSLKNTNTKDIIFKDNDFSNHVEKMNKTSNKFINIRLKKSKLNLNKLDLKIERFNKNNISSYNNNLKNMNEHNINFLYNKIFPKIFPDHIKYNVIDNKLNLFYAEDEKHFQNKLKIKNIKLMQQGKRLRKMVLDKDYATDKLNSMKKTVGFLKGIADFAYPDIVLKKSKLINQKFNIKMKKLNSFKLPYKIFEEEKNKNNLIMAKSLSETIKINNLKKRSINKSF